MSQRQKLATYQMKTAMSGRDWGIVMLGQVNPIPDGFVQDWSEDEIAVFRDPPNKRDFFSTLTGGNYVASKSLADYLSKMLSEQVQFLPIRMESIDGERAYAGFSVLHPVQVGSPADWSWKETASRRICMTVAGQLVVTEVVMEELLAKGFHGIQFVAMRN